MGLRLLSIEVKHFRGHGDFHIDGLDKVTALTGPNGAGKSTTIDALLLLSESRMHRYADLPSWVNPGKHDPARVTLGIRLRLELTSSLKNLLADPRLRGFLSRHYNRYIQQHTRKDEDKDSISESFVGSCNRALYGLRVPLPRALEEGLHSAIKKEVYPNHAHYAYAVNKHGQALGADYTFRHAKYLVAQMEMDHVNGPQFELELRDEKDQLLVGHELFFHWMSATPALLSSESFAYAVFCTFFHGTRGDSPLQMEEHATDNIKHDDAYLAASGENLEQYLTWMLGHEPEELGQALDAFERVFGIRLRLRVNHPGASVSEDVILARLGNEPQFALSRMANGMLSGLRVLLQVAAARPGDILVLDEPELHLHPGALRALLAELRVAAASCQILVATHSPAVLDERFIDTIVLHEYERKPRPLQTAEIRSALDALGALGSDALLYDAIVWVEGAHDQNFLRRVFELLDQPGTPVSFPRVGIVPYGGATNLPGLNLPALHGVCQRCVLVLDGDKANDPALKKIAKAAKKAKVPFMFLKRWSIEHYYPHAVVDSVCKLAAGSYNPSPQENIKAYLPTIGASLSKGQLSVKVANMIQLADILQDKALLRELKDLRKHLKLP